MNNTTTFKKNYRVVGNTKFMVTKVLTIFMCILAIAGISYFIMKNYVINKPYEFNYSQGNIEITAYSKNEYIKKLEEEVVNQNKIAYSKIELKQTELDTIKEELNDQKELYSTLEVKYNKEINNRKELIKEDMDLYSEYSYAINYPGSDMTLDDIKNIIELCKSNNVNPHVWLGLVQLESHYNSNARSKSSTAAGWGQVLRGTGEYVYEQKLKLGNYNHTKMGTDKEINAEISIKYLGDLIKQYGVQRALVAYNGGELGTKYATIVSQNVRKNTGESMTSLQKTYL